MQVDFVTALWQRALAPDQLVAVPVSLAIAAVCLALILVAWPGVRMVVTVCHEAGHAVAAVSVGRRLSGIKVHADSSGLTLSRGRPRGPGMAFTLFAGYPAAALVGLGVAGLAGSGHAAGALWLIVVLLGLMLLNMRNVYGAVVVLAVGAVVAVASWFAPAPLLGWLAHGVAWTLLLAAPRPVWEVAGNRNPGTDPAKLAVITHVPRTVWVGLWLIITVGALAVGANLLLPGAVAGLIGH